MSVTVSSKYQVVIPKEIRKKLAVRPGQKIAKISVEGTKIVYETEPEELESTIEKYAGTLKNTEWQKAGMDAAAWVRKMRDEEWD